jgi:hypothetical protein
MPLRHDRGGAVTQVKTITFEKAAERSIAAQEVL